MSPGRRTRAAALAALVTALAVCAAAVLAACGPATAPPGAPAPERLAVRVLAVLPHDRTRFTEGLELRDGVLYESSGLYGRSAVTATAWPGGAVLAQSALPNGLFGEGLTVVGDRIWQLTWREGIALARRRSDLAVLGETRYPGQGWGLCYDGRRLVMSDGSARLTFRDPASFARLGAVAVTDAGRPVPDLNELECAGGSVWADVWKSDDLLRIDPASGRVTAVADASALRPSAPGPADRTGEAVLNGIAAIPGSPQFLLTGKFWPAMYRVVFVPAGRTG
ncbi:glutaminyl-peptide cyclotransferase [Streptacidiphilus sp. PB12-B1b]|uniref:glutaminyl-peptide cyclotransferase n=1 Tax=Streptacidiphilus sp. PB12-B1b TaxID=2705012 RepID=UPI0015F9672A|nr:glutaminyl-peptide cyclotransferase [Streptacidiphilus sp. PB12-B1b]QMU76605.1 glutaminyl-peptide cyclotransferase [Streptacidiphilus sp. PB12-B1b]